MHFEVQNFDFFCPCAGLVHFEVQNPMHLFICILILFLLLADILDAYDRIWHFLLPMQLFEGSGAFFMQRVYNLKINWTLFRTRFWFQEIGVFFPFEMSI